MAVKRDVIAGRCKVTQEILEERFDAHGDGGEGSQTLKMGLSFSIGNYAT